MLVNLSSATVVVCYCSKIELLKVCFQKTIRVTNSLDPDEKPRYASKLFAKPALSNHLSSILKASYGVKGYDSLELTLQKDLVTLLQIELSRSKKRDTESLGDVPNSLEKKHRGLSGSADNLLDIEKDEQDTATDGTESSDTDCEGTGKVSHKQKIFAKKLIKREKKKEKEQRKKVEKNIISMDDFLRKQAEFKMWLYEEKSKNAGDLSSPKLKSMFKQFVRYWNKRKLPQKYYRSLTCPDSPAPLTPKKFNFMAEDSENSSPLSADRVAPEVKEPPKSPFVTFGKTPPKVLKSKKLQLFASSQDVALISVVPIGSPQVTPAFNKENSGAGKGEIYNIPKNKTKQGSNVENKDTASKLAGAVPYKVSVFPWAMSQDRDSDTDNSLDVCSTATPPYSRTSQEQDDEVWPAPPTESELNSYKITAGRKNESPHVPPPPPPRSASLSSEMNPELPPPPLSATYSDPYDTLPDSDSRPRSYSSDYQEPADSVVNTKTMQEDARMVLNSLNSQNGTQKDKLYSKSVSEKREFSKEELEELYAKPMKRPKKSDSGTVETEKRKEAEFHSELYSEIMEHLNMKKNEDASRHTEPVYETIDECLAKMEDSTVKRDSERSITNEYSKDITSKSEDRKFEPQFAKLTKAKKRTVLAASSDKIYETYLSMGKNANPFKSKDLTKKVRETETKPLKKRFKSQPDISFSEDLQLHQSSDITADSNTDFATPKPFLSSFKPVDAPCHVGSPNTFFKVEVNKYKLSDKAKSYDDGLGEINPPGTPTILATPSFESLYSVTPLSKKSGSSQSLPAHQGSSESLSEMSVSTSSSLSCAPDDHSGSMQSLHSEKSLPPVLEEIDELDEGNNFLKNQNMKETLETKERPSVESGKPGLIQPPTPGKISGGIDLSVYLLKPTKQVENTACPSDVNDRNVKLDHERNDLLETAAETARTELETLSGHRLYDMQSRLAIKESLSGVKTKVDQSKIPPPPVRRHTVQTVQEIKTSMAKKSAVNHGQVPVIGIASRARKFTKSKEDVNSDNNFKRQKVEATQVVGVGDEQYLETDIDIALTEKGRQPLKKSKSHSGFEQETSNVVTEIW